MQQTKFISCMGDSSLTRILDFLITGRDFDYSLSDIAKNAGVSWATLSRVWPRLVANGLVVQTRTIGRAKLFRLNSESEVVRSLAKLYKTILQAGTGPPRQDEQELNSDTLGALQKARKTPEQDYVPLE